MADTQPSSGSRDERRRLRRLGALVARRPRQILVGWLLLVVVLGLLGIGLEKRASTRTIFSDGSAAKHEHEIAIRQFGSESSVVVLLHGPSREVARQGMRLERWYDQVVKAFVVSPWTPGAAIEGLRPSPGTAALIVNVRGAPTDDVTKILPDIERGIDRVTAPPVRVSVAGAPAIIDSVQKANAQAVKLGQLIAFPALILILLLVFRSVLAAVVPIVAGGAVAAVSRGALDLVARVTHVEVLAIGAMGMMSLALGVDYALLIVSRFREELAKGAEIPEAVELTVTSTGRTVLMAGGGLSLAMLVAPLILTGDIVISICIAVIIATVLSVLSALLVVPALLTVLGHNLDRWMLPLRRESGGFAAALSVRLSKHPRLVVVPIVLFLALASAWALTLDTGALAIAQLPPDDSGRVQQEEVQHALGPGWVAPLEVVIEDSDGPVTSPSRMRALVAFQRKLERDPGVETVSDVAALVAGARRLEGLETTLAAQERSSAKLSTGLSRLHRGASQGTARLAGAVTGAGQLNSALGATGSGSEALAHGLQAVARGSDQMETGLERAGGGSGEVAGKTGQASQGAKALTAGLERAGKQTATIESSAGVMESAMKSGERRLDETDAAVSNVASSLSGALKSLRTMTVGKGDSEYQSTLNAIEAASARLSGVDPQTGEETGAANTVTTSVRRARGQFDLGLYLAGRQAQSGEKANDGVAKLLDGSSKLDAGLEKLVAGTHSLNDGIAELSARGQALSPALGQLRDGAERLTSGLGKLQQGSEGFATGLGTGSAQSRQLALGLGKISAGVKRQSGESTLDSIRKQSPGLFRSGYLFLAGIDGSQPSARRQASALVSLRHGGSAARLLVISHFDPTDSRASDTRFRIEDDARALAQRTGAEVVVGGSAAMQQDINTTLRAQTPITRLVLAGVTIVILLLVMRALIVPLIAGLLNLLTVAATFGILALLFDNSLLGGPGYVDTTVLPAAIVVIFGLAIDYEVFVFSRMREEYVQSGSNDWAVTEGVTRTAPVVTGAAIVMIVVFLSFSVSSFSLMRDFGVAQAIGVSIDAFLIRLLVVPALMRALGKRAWWMPAWLDRLLPGVPNAVAAKRASAG